MTWFLVISFPLVVLAHRMSVNMGHKGLPVHQSWRDALHCAKGADVVSIVIAALILAR